jgi:hypothetical protein
MALRQSLAAKPDVERVMLELVYAYPIDEARKGIGKCNRVLAGNPTQEK